jgi:hypothetical protein
LTAATSAEATSVSSIAETASGDEIACQKPWPPLFFESQTSAASGIRTIRLR